MSDPETQQNDPAPTSQRIDKWLWFARVCKSRTLAAELVAAGKVRLNRTHIDKASQTVKPGDILTIAIATRIRVLEVRGPGTRRGPAPEAQLLFADLTPPPPPRDPTGLAPVTSGRDAGTGRPTKRDRRLTDKLRDED